MGNVKKIVAPIVGMTFFWAYFRYQAVFGTLYPLGSEVSVFGYGIQLYTVFLIEALVLSVIALFFFKKSGGCYSCLLRRFCYTVPRSTATAFHGRLPRSNAGCSDCEGRASAPLGQ
ncbi:hypothetical protein GO719_08980, partial [Eggerthella lenta]|uniref:hypothetical protein n=1 Tax=Eggerthella lenta TaxID=84112 RepID=UPI0012EE3D50